MDSASGAIRRLFGSRGYSNGQQNLSGLFLNLNTVSYHYWTITAYHSLNEYDQIGGNTQIRQHSDSATHRFGTWHY